MKKGYIDQYEKESSIYYSSPRLWDDGVILPEDTRRVLGNQTNKMINIL